MVFSPREGMHIMGEVNQIGRDYVGLLVLGVFNAAVPMAEVPPEMQHRLAVGARLLIELTGIHVAHDRLSLSGSLLAPGTRIISDTPKKHKRKESKGAAPADTTAPKEAVQAPEEAAPAPVEEVKHKKKRAKKEKKERQGEAADDS